MGMAIVKQPHRQEGKRMMTEARPGGSTEMAINARRIDFTSSINGTGYRLFVSEPAGDPPAGGWPVVYLIDGCLHFGIAVDTARIQGRWPDTADAVIVGIGYQTDSVATALDVRTFDLTPPTPASVIDRGWQRHMGLRPDAFGGMDAFLRVLEEEVKPRAEAAARIDPADQTLIGHSLGGLATLAVLLRNPGAFQQYVAISPSIWVADRWVLGFVDEFAVAAEAGKVRARLLVSAGELEESDPPFPPFPRSGMPLSPEVYGEMMRDCAMVTEVNALARRLEPVAGNGFDVRLAIHPEEDHRSVVPAGIARGIYYCLYRP